MVAPSPALMGVTAAMAAPKDIGRGDDVWHYFQSRREAVVALYWLSTLNSIHSLISTVAIDQASAPWLATGEGYSAAAGIGGLLAARWLFSKFASDSVASDREKARRNPFSLYLLAPTTEMMTITSDWESAAREKLCKPRSWAVFKKIDHTLQQLKGVGAGWKNRRRLGR